MTRLRKLAGASAACMLLATAALFPATPAFAQADQMGGIGQTETITTRATVKGVDQQARTVTLAGANGRTMTLKVGDEVQNLAQVKPGNRVVAVYRASITYVLVPPGTKLPDDSMTVAGARAAPGQKPGAAIGTRTILTRMVTGVDMATHTLNVVDPAGGQIQTVNVTSSQGQQAMNSVKVGDSITAILTEAVAVAVEPAR